MNQTALAQPGGLTSAEVAARIAAGQVNRVRRSSAAEYADIVRRNFFTLFNALVVPAAIALLVLQEYRPTISVSGMAIINTVLGLVQEIRAKRHLDRLAILTETKVRAVRDGRTCEVSNSDVVLGDHLLLAAGEPIVADGAVLEARFLEVDEALLTGESDPVPRRPGDRLLSGSFCVAGEGRYRADRVGAEAFAQHTAAQARSYRYAASPLQKTIDRLIVILTALTLVLCALYVVLYALRDVTDRDLFRMIAATVTTMVPQGLVLMTTLAFILGAVRMSQRGALVQRLNAVESMASIDVLCMDKTGTLTTNRLHLERVRPVAGVSEEAARDRLRLFASATLDTASKSVAALRAALGAAPVELLDQIPFKSQNRYSAVRVRSGGEVYVLVLGAGEALRPFLRGGDGGWETAWKELIATGLRLLLFGEADPTDRPAFDGTLEGFGLRPLALVALSDELRQEAGTVLAHLAEQGIRFKIVSGDNPETVRATVAPLAANATAPALRALAEGPVVTGAELEASSKRTELIGTHGVFGRVAPEQKVEIVVTLKEQGRHVAMIGDGVNDVLPIKNAHLGIAMGEGSQASKTVAGLVLETNDFGLLPATLEEGRTILRNLRRAAKLFLLKNVYVLILIVGALGLFRLPFPFVPQQVTLLNLLTIGLPALLLTLGKGPAGPARPGFLREVGWFALRTGVVMGAAGLVLMLLSAPPRERRTVSATAAVGLLGSPTGFGPLQASESLVSHRELNEGIIREMRTMLLSLLILLGAASLPRVLTDGSARSMGGDRWFRWMTAAVVPLYLVALYWPPSAWYHELTPLSLTRWGLVLAVALPALGALFLTDRLRSP
jgi:cation-transporting ATPase E